MAIYNIREVISLSKLQNLNEGLSPNSIVPFDSLSMKINQISKKKFLESKILAEEFFFEENIGLEKLTKFFKNYRESLELDRVIEELHDLNQTLTLK